MRGETEFPTREWEIGNSKRERERERGEKVERESRERKKLRKEKVVVVNAAAKFGNAGQMNEEGGLCKK